MQGFTLMAIADAENNKLGRNFDVKINKVNGPWKYRSRALGQDACLKGMSRKITMQGFTLMAITDAENNKLQHKN